MLQQLQALGLAFLLSQFIRRAFFSPTLASFLFCFVCFFVGIQFTHSRAVRLDQPLLPTAVRPPYKEPVRANKKQTMYAEKFRSVFRETCYFKGRSEVPLELITVVPEIRQGGSCSVDSQEMEKTERGWEGEESLQEVQLSFLHVYIRYTI